MALRNVPVTIRGAGLECAYAGSPGELVRRLAAGESVATRPWFASEREAADLRLPGNPHHAAFFVGEAAQLSVMERAQQVLERVIAQALQDASLDESALGGPDVRVYVAGHGMRPDIGDFAGYENRNDDEDLLYFPKLKGLSVASYAQDELAHRLAVRYRLAAPPVPIYTASCSAMSSLYLAWQAIRAGFARRALVVGWMQYTLQDIVFMGGQGVLGVGNSQPFSAQSGGMLPADGACALLLEAADDAPAAAPTSQIQIASCVAYQSSGEARSAITADFRAIAATMERALEGAALKPEDIACVVPHANGTPASDKSEAMAILKIWGKKGVPVVTYKGQTGYMSVCSGLLDLFAIGDALVKQQVLPAQTRLPLDDTLQIDFHVNRAALPLAGGAILKSTLGLDGSIVACVLTQGPLPGGLHEVRSS
ncbi:beta-ketoacyl synthase N-terminal-like domain-containing protein [Paraburkholderia oxyphila]|uniref:beta-ketoacyl synthase N-terminal-like domain-containing protein n=1 Tax=Paraburkholderia oxyphila TaxID=614212 RepID=UPI0004801813|nr:beta-ketoacyl synthase N-terminal-like domain-containing protein [Paraburkholderia oxyphila]